MMTEKGAKPAGEIWKKRRLEEEKQKVEEVLTEKRSKDKRKKKRIFPPPEPGNVKLEEPPRKIKRLEEMHIKSLEEIKQEKALRMQQIAKPAGKEVLHCLLC